LGRIVAAFKPDFAFICHDSSCRSAIIHDAFRSSSQFEFLNPPIGRLPWRELGRDPAALTMVRMSVAGDGVIGPCGPRSGSSSGERGGNSSGRGGSPGSCAGGGTSGRGVPGGLSGGGSAGRPGSIGGSLGSVGIVCALRNFDYRGAGPIAPDR
jgi:hypothetical protein